MKSLKSIIEGFYSGIPEDEIKFIDAHGGILKTADANGNDDKLFKASNIKQVKRRADHHGYEAGEDSFTYDAGEADNKDITKPDREKKKAVKEERDFDGMSLKDFEYRQELARNSLIRNKDRKSDYPILNHTHKDQKKNVKKDTEQLDEAAGTSRYRGKYPDKINKVSSGLGTGPYAHITTNDGKKYRVHAKDTNYEMPKPGEHIDKYDKKEALNELSAKTLKNYISNSVGNLRVNSFKRGLNYNSTDDATQKKGENKAGNRQRGIIRAANKLADKAVNETSNRFLKKNNLDEEQEASKDQVLERSYEKGNKKADVHYDHAEDQWHVTHHDKEDQDAASDNDHYRNDLLDAHDAAIDYVNGRKQQKPLTSSNNRTKREQDHWLGHYKKLNKDGSSPSKNKE